MWYIPIFGIINSNFYEVTKNPDDIVAIYNIKKNLKYSNFDQTRKVTKTFLYAHMRDGRVLQLTRDTGLHRGPWENPAVHISQFLGSYWDKNFMSIYGNKIAVNAKFAENFSIVPIDVNNKYRLAVNHKDGSTFNLFATSGNKLSMSNNVKKANTSLKEKYTYTTQKDNSQSM